MLSAFLPLFLLLPFLATTHESVGVASVPRHSNSNNHHSSSSSNSNSNDHHSGVSSSVGRDGAADVISVTRRLLEATAVMPRHFKVVAASERAARRHRALFGAETPVSVQTVAQHCMQERRQAREEEEEEEGEGGQNRARGREKDHQVATIIEWPFGGSVGGRLSEEEASRCLASSLAKSRYHSSPLVLWQWAWEEEEEEEGEGEEERATGEETERDFLDRLMERTHVNSGVFLVKRRRRVGAGAGAGAREVPPSSHFEMSELYRSGPGAGLVAHDISSWPPGPTGPGGGSRREEEEEGREAEL